MYCWFFNVEIMANTPYLMSEESFSNTRVFFWKGHRSTLVLRSSRQQSALYLGATLNSKISNKSTKIKNKQTEKPLWNIDLNRLWKGHSFTQWKPKQIRALPYPTSYGNREHALQAMVNQFFTALHMFMNNHENTVNIDSGLQINFSKWAFTNMNLQIIWVTFTSLGGDYSESKLLATHPLLILSFL